ncbi:integrase core domain-containing protein [Streptomyces sparsogenes]|uniref:integrase core domain-containing protein n=1 Tax=Streptomyces sparsogenes TaxID=67365 RepID=UPI0033E01ADE
MTAFPAPTGAAGTKLRTRDREFGFTNVRSAALWKLRELLDPAFGAELALPPDDLLVADLTTPTWDITTGVSPKIKVEPKEDVAARLGRSPDRGDAVAMSLFADYLAASKLHAPGGQRYGRPTTQGLPATTTGPGRRITGVTARPTRDWAVQQARNLTSDLGIRIETLRFLLRDRDGKYGEAFDAVFQAEEMEILKSAPQAPRMNAHCERMIGSIRREALDHVLIMNEAHARHVLAAYERHYNEHRPHQARNQLPPDAHEQPAAAYGLSTSKVLRARILGGLINEYRYAA